MKTNHSIVKALVMLTIAFGVQTTANAQFGGLLKKAKQAVKAKNDTKESEVKGKILDRKSQGVSESGEVTIKERKSGKVIGVYDRATRTLTHNGKTYVFGKDGAVTDGNGTQVGSIIGEELTTPHGDKLRCDDIGIVFIGKENVGSIQNNKMAIMQGNIYADASDKMEREVLAYLVFGVMNTNERLLKGKEAYEDATMTEKETDEEFYARSNKELQKRFASSGTGGRAVDMQLRKGGSIVGSILADGTVYVGGHIAGKIDADGNIYVGGHIEGGIRNDEVLKNGHVVGTIDSDGTVRLNGSIVGGIDSRTGDVRQGGSIIGRVEPLGDMKKAAVFYFFGFY